MAAARRPGPGVPKAHHLHPHDSREQQREGPAAAASPGAQRRSPPDPSLSLRIQGEVWMLGLKMREKIRLLAKTKPFLLVGGNLQRSEF